MRLAISSLFVLLLMCGCESTQKQEPIKVDTEPLAAGDCIFVVFQLEEPLPKPQQFIIDSSGDISLLYVGEIHLTGLTPKQAAQRIYDAYVPKCFSMMNVSVRRCQ